MPSMIPEKDELFLAVEEDRDGCDQCGTEALELQRCSACRAARYCCRGCQKKAWEKHRVACFRFGA
ncbi:hypothetical protein DFJ74DRAFT_712917 [Hyaloraphidium curvatum]|nr:hypothetical protein DFJ74DRAFT_712917 [Hyaloraphidium curvatum]